MDYETICAGNRKLYGQLEDISYKLKDLDEFYDHDSIKILTEHKQYLNKLIDHNLECLDIIWAHASDYRPARRYCDRPQSKNVMAYYRANPDATLPVIAALCGVSHYTVSRIISDHLYH